MTLALLPALKKTRVWQEFEDKILAKYEEKYPGEQIKIKRHMPEEYYPELMLEESNCGIERVGGDGKPVISEYGRVGGCINGLRRLSACILEVLGYEAE